MSESATFEESFGGLQQTIEQLEQGGMPLESALDLFEQGMKLAATCQAMLDRAELRLTRLADEHALGQESSDEG